MVRLAPLSFVFVLAACPPKPAGNPQQPPVTGAACPTAAGVYVTSYVTQDAAKGRTGWVLPLHSMPVELGAAVPDYAPLDAAAAAASGVPPGPTGALWLVTSNAPPCRVQLGGHYAAKIEGPPASISYGIELDGCPAPTDPQESGGVALVSEQTPTACRFEVPQPVAARMGEMNAQQQWEKPAKETPIPPIMAAVIPPHECKAPGCEELWAIGEVDVANRPVAWSGAVNWLAVADPAAPCTWKTDRFSGWFAPGPDAKPVKIEDGHDHSLVLTAVLVDASGAKVALAEGPGEYATYDLAPGTATIANHITWMAAPTEAWDMVDHLGPLCEAKPAPLPKDAKPVSPYP